MDTADLKRGDVVKVGGWGKGIAFTFVGHPTTWTEETAEPCEACHGVGALDTDFETVCNDCGGNGVAFWYDPEEVEDTDRALVVMVGDNTRHTVDMDDLEPLAELDYCHVCGQMGCTHDGLDRSEA